MTREERIAYYLSSHQLYPSRVKITSESHCIVALEFPLEMHENCIRIVVSDMGKTQHKHSKNVLETHAFLIQSSVKVAYFPQSHSVLLWTLILN